MASFELHSWSQPLLGETIGDEHQLCGVNVGGDGEPESGLGDCWSRRSRASRVGRACHLVGASAGGWGRAARRHLAEVPGRSRGAMTTRRKTITTGEEVWLLAAQTRRVSPGRSTG
jgi:hypothetical protein